MNSTLEFCMTLIVCCGAIVATIMTITFVSAAVESLQDWWND